MSDNMGKCLALTTSVTMLLVAFAGIVVVALNPRPDNQRPPATRTVHVNPWDTVSVALDIDTALTMSTMKIVCGAGGENCKASFSLAPPDSEAILHRWGHARYLRFVLTGASPCEQTEVQWAVVDRDAQAPDGMVAVRRFVTRDSTGCKEDQ